MFESSMRILPRQRTDRLIGPWGAGREGTDLGQTSSYGLKEGVKQKPTDTSIHQDLLDTQPATLQDRGGGS